MPITQSNTFCVPTQNPVVIQFALGFVSGQSRDCKGAVSREDRSFTVAVLIKLTHYQLRRGAFDLTSAGEA